MLKESINTEACWNCRLYDDCNKKYYITSTCENYVSCIKNTRHITKFECTDKDIVNLD